MPAQLLSDFVSNGLRSFRIKGPKIHVNESPRVAVHNLAAQPVDRVVVAFHRDQPGAVTVSVVFEGVL